MAAGGGELAAGGGVFGAAGDAGGAAGVFAGGAAGVDMVVTKRKGKKDQHLRLA